MKHEKDIYISQDDCIVWIEFDQKTKSELEVDNLLNPTNELWTKLETVCEAACCGINAFNLWPDNIQKAIEDLDKDRLLQNLNDVRKTVMASKAEVVSSDKLNNLFHRKVFIQLLDHVIKNIGK